MAHRYIPKPKHNPFTIKDNASRAIGRFQTSTTKGAPASAAWAKAVSLAPPSPFQPRGVVPSEAGQFPESSHHALQRDALLSIRRIPHKNYSKKDRRMVSEKTHRPNRYYYTPPVIAYPQEDELRKVFYDTHPFELARPTVLVETEDTMSDKLELENFHTAQVSGETVIRHAMHLMHRQALPREEAYKQALDLFYTARAREDAQAQEKRAQRIEAAEKTPATAQSDPSGGRPWTLLYIKEEQEHLSQTEVFLTRKQQERAESLRAQKQPSIF
ncbi:hypothetical protein SeMB42_g07589 [Synchytrium endobioticum]|uniref:Small ribosomal subunit protein mS23 n=1 Tax=Synchytrium endobioticum TaxID=286115 RepID=A0A507C546_9FUNG|nr:hypothetical protein SeMB42_g07589 [Synchytrium endobioticum]TPX47918.1 hypothetical protein SeLEV6574_g02377 [Synchytrium endobioticum]